MGKRVTRQAIMRNIAAATEAGLSIAGIAPDGTILTPEAVMAPDFAVTKAKATANSCDEILNQLTGSD